LFTSETSIKKKTKKLIATQHWDLFCVLIICQLS